LLLIGKRNSRQKNKLKKVRWQFSRDSNVLWKRREKKNLKMTNR